MKIKGMSVMGRPTYFVTLIPSVSQETPIVRMCSNLKQAAELTLGEARDLLPIVQQCYPTAMIVHPEDAL